MTTSNKRWIQTFSGKKFDPLDPKPEDIDIEDIATALSNICRYGGHVSRFMSVAEHSYLVSLRVQELGGDLYDQKWALLHDASEAYIGDIVRPLKTQPLFEDYLKVEKRLMAAIVGKYGLNPLEPKIVKDTDWEMLGTEVDQLKRPIHPEWGATTSTGKLPEPLTHGHWGTRVLGEPPYDARFLFLKRFDDLWSIPSTEPK